MTIKLLDITTQKTLLSNFNIYKLTPFTSVSAWLYPYILYICLRKEETCQIIIIIGNKHYASITVDWA